MVNMSTRIPPPKPGAPIPKEYVRQQLNTLGIKNVTEEDLEAYATGKVYTFGCLAVAQLAHTAMLYTPTL